MKDILSGVGTALVTPFQNNKIDFEGLERLIDYNIEGDIDYLVILGSTGETATLSFDEKQQLVNHTISYTDKRIPIVVGLGGNNTLEVEEKLNWCNKLPIDAILSVCPFYNRPSQNGIQAHFKTIGNRSKHPVILYNVPARTGINLNWETTINLAEEEKICGIKEAYNNFDQINSLLANKPDDFLFLSGEDSITFPILALGGDGVISVLSNLLPNEVSMMVKKTKASDFSAAREIHKRLNGFYCLINKEGNPASIKKSLEIIKIIRKEVRLPLVPASDYLGNRFNEELKKLGIINHP